MPSHTDIHRRGQLATTAGWDRRIEVADLRRLGCLLRYWSSTTSTRRTPPGNPDLAQRYQPVTLTVLPGKLLRGAHRASLAR